MSFLPEAALDELKDLLGPKGFSMESDVLAAHNAEARGKFEGHAEIILFPASTEEVAKAVAICAAHDIAIVPQGGNTGRCGGAVADSKQVLINLKRMNRVIEIDGRDFTATVEAGAILQNIQEAAEKQDLLFPLSLGAEGTCQIGGNLATNAGGLNVIRYGNARDLCLGLEVVLPDGTVWNGLSKLRKDNTGYDLRDLFIGAEGTLGIITKATLKLFAQPKHIATAWIAVPSPECAIDLLALARRHTGDAIAAFELISSFAHDLSVTYLKGLTRPLATKTNWHVLIELTSSRPKDDLETLLVDLLAQAVEIGLATDATLAQSEAQRKNLWAIREGIPEAQGYEGGSIKHDVSVPVSKVAELLKRGMVRADALIPGIRPCPFGHVGDGNIHFNFTQPATMDKQAYLAQWESLNSVIHDIVVELGGSISAEHGIGQLKRDELAHYASVEKLKLLHAIKAAIDPDGRLNPGKVV
ncbi:FAD-binding oxidoreductase [Thalassospira tepidiphila]|uniref:2-hydroxyacid dehydrogenase n=2 Tax=Thalassospira tepidiphila TaxID=393657 RepID=A0A853L0S1_9PROT|nr:FAD-binding oxidoreductase [Thalassospira tepidiphila]NJB74709.1 FAD/FMN-containing dehydrogenase [Thalassospira tepidiphila]OAZ10123.1 2-hydroxyacid dehydrogenase [Thalassospira tepidiphila MCCC 1A03514]